MMTPCPHEREEEMPSDFVLVEAVARKAYDCADAQGCCLVGCGVTSGGKLNGGFKATVRILTGTKHPILPEVWDGVEIEVLETDMPEAQ